jgi:hypothetical protein
VRKISGQEIVLGALVATAFWAVIYVLTSDSSATYEICEPTKEGAKECARYHVIGFAAREIGRGLEAYNGLLTAIATIFIAWFTLTLRRSTDRLWKAAIDQGRLTESALAQLEGPLIDISKIETNLTVGGFVDKPPSVSVHFKNHGRGPATISVINCRFMVAEEIPSEPQYLAGAISSTTLILGAGQETDAPYIYELETPPGEPGTGTQLVGYLLFFGLIEYRGFFGGTHTFAFGCAPDRKHNTFEAQGGATYNYRKYDPDRKE